MLKKQVIAFLFFIFSYAIASAQQLTISGTITDDTGKPVPFASILIRNTTKGTSANGDGVYSINVTAGNYDLLFKAIGFQQETRKATVNQNVVLDVKLAIASYQLNDVVVHAGGEDPAYGIIRKAIRKRKTYLNEVNAYSADVYLKGLQKLLAAPKKFLGRDINQIGREIGLDSNRRGIVYLSESQSKLSFIKPDLFHEEMISSKVSGSNQAFSFNRASDIRVNMYENFQYWDQLSNRPLISPIADNALNFYNYKWLGTIEENGETINKIQLIPKHAFEPVFSGLIYIVENSWRIHSFDIQITKSANLNIVDTLKVKEQYMPVGSKVWMPASVKFEFTGGFLGFKFGGYFIAVYSNYDLNPTLNKKDFAEVLRVPKGVNKKDSTYWQQERPIPLTTEETTDYQKKAILATKRESKSYLDSLDRVYNKITPGKFLLTGMPHRNRYKKEYLLLDPVIPALLYNTVEGFAINYGATFVKQIDTVTNKYIRLSSHVRYGFADHLFHANTNGTIPLGDFNLGFSGGTGMYDLNNLEPISVLSNTYNTLLRRRNLQKIYEKEFGQLSLSHRIVGGWQASVSTEYANRKWYPNSSFYSFFKRDKAFTANNPYTPDSDQPLFPENQSFTVNLRTSYNFSNKYVSYPSGKYYLPSDYPTLELNYTKGIKNVFGSDVDYNLLAVSLAKDDIGMGKFGKSAFYIGAGKFFNAKKLYYPDYAQFFGSDGFGYSIATSRFILLDMYDYSTPDKYFEAHLEQNFHGYFLNNIPLIRKLKLQEIVNFNYLGNPTAHNYYEAAAGVHYLNFRVMYAMSFKDGVRLNSGVRIGILLPQRRGSR
ncbi:DUF5686 and carboxypeptidase regulatory-like domain-containing protein [Mucilaginibacter polytrichastri]|uniref:Carboxypeptidase-like regulatory domain-containing protein n=1 Tax=Mucilaginibacter polytrichastri TaxID=1302689 RepID=A0A1Q6A181_9SPHI|nr:DUF5686 and carboxypeptidase regulatory-like domain-containing protein [Mucilaginibacter polytrichastri]OKS87732.1 hypothetical protein RG47T_3194 [Mucilaginibacter polytrichastri]SFT19930.1 CarboxypepD_reg-like domain-containing protein [Mucilaginibacter polytrichastri]